MSVVALQIPEIQDIAEADARLEWLKEAVSKNRFLPEPDPRQIFVGDGNFREIGAEFLGHLVRIGGLQPDDRVLDIGSGLGRIAIPLTQYLSATTTYLGLDPAKEGIAWSQRHVTPTYPNFRFKHLDVAHEIYNPNGLHRGETLVLPVGDRSIDFAFMVSVVTHLPPAEVIVYAREAFRVLAPGGRLFITNFMMDESAQAPGVKDPRCDFKRSGDGPDWYIDQATKYGAVAFDDGWLESVLTQAGFRIALRSLGHWRGTRAAHYQDIIVATKPGQAA